MSYTRELRDTILDLLDDWKTNCFSDECKNFIEKETDLKISDCKEYGDSFDFTILGNPTIEASLDILELGDSSSDYYINEFHKADEIEEQFHNLDENEFRSYMYKIFTDEYINYNNLGYVSIIKPGYSSGSTFTIKSDNYWTMSMIDQFIKVYKLIIIHQHEYTVYINDEEFNEDDFDVDNLKACVIKILIKCNLIDINTLFDKNTIEMIYKTVLNKYIDDFVKELFSNDELRENFSNNINNTILEMIENNELNI